MIGAFKRGLDLTLTVGRQAVPLNGILWAGWQPASAIAVFWLESVLLVAVAVVLCWRLARRTSQRAIAEARTAGDADREAELERERSAARQAGVEPQSVLLFHGGSLAVFGVFIGLMLFLIAQKSPLDHPFEWSEFRAGATAVAIFIGVGFAVDLFLFPSISVAAVQSRVDACLGRWALLWLLGFAGTLLMVFTGRAGAFIGLFAVLKAVWETWGALARFFGWTSLRDRNAATITAGPRAGGTAPR